MDLSSRDKEIVKELLIAGGFITVDSIAKKMNISTKTVRNDITET